MPGRLKTMTVTTKMSIFACVIFIAIFVFANCDNEFGPKQLDITISEGTKPVFSWNGTPVHRLTVLRSDTTVVISEFGSIIERHPRVWGIYSVDENGKDFDGIFSPVEYGARIDNTVDISDSLFRCESLKKGVHYTVFISDKSPGYMGNKSFIVK